jgi:hypothetical protein
MPRYCKQRDNHSCGPIALINLGKWIFPFAGYTLSDLEFFKSITKCNKQTGTSLKNFSRILHNWLKYPYIRKVKSLDLNITELFDWVKTGNAIVFQYVYNLTDAEVQEHYSLCTEVTERDPAIDYCDSFTLINDESGNLYRKMKWWDFQNLLNKKHGSKHSHIWMIKKS